MPICVSYNICIGINIFFVSVTAAASATASAAVSIIKNGSICECSLYNNHYQARCEAIVIHSAIHGWSKTLIDNKELWRAFKT